MDIFDIDPDLYSETTDAQCSEAADARAMIDDEVVKSIIEALKEDDDSMVHLLTTNIWEIDFKGSTSQMVFNLSLKTILAQTSPDEQITTFLRDKIWSFTKIFPEERVVEDILQNTLYSKKHVSKHTRLRDIPMHDLKEMVRDVMTACNLDHPWYKMWHFSRDVTRIYSPFDPTSYPGYFQASDPKDMFAVALNICSMQPSAASVCEQDYFTKRFQIGFFPLSDLLDHKFDIKASRRYDRFIAYDGKTIKLRALTLYDIQVLKYLIKHFDSDAARSIYQLLASMMMSEKDIRLAHDIGWFSGISSDVFAEARQKTYLLPDATCESSTFSAMENITKDNNNLLKGFMRDFKYQSSTSPANIWIAVTSLIFALVSVIQFFMGL
ncbi:hypothetical protein BG006_001727 [Podila minutissima]|uniref:Uncharacterized protein n=1 Tax=Podila minutissima TaxID=64525 RepID=A0A9P5S9Z7_9FUNG|nr:hypothetical protein BG006_001727 [Podila minutissima]